jgi:hypothetical protein
LTHFARRPQRDAPDLLAPCRVSLGAGYIEGSNSKITVSKRMTNGSYDDACFFKIRAAFPELGDDPKKGPAEAGPFMLLLVVPI